MTIEYIDYIEEDTVATLYRQTGSGTSLIIRPMLFAWDSMPAGCERILSLHTGSSLWASMHLTPIKLLAGW